MTEPDAWEYDRIDDDVLCPKLVHDKITAKKFGDSKEPLFAESTIQEEIWRIREEIDKEIQDFQEEFRDVPYPVKDILDKKFEELEEVFSSE